MVWWFPLWLSSWNPSKEKQQQLSSISLTLLVFLKKFLNIKGTISSGKCTTTNKHQDHHWLLHRLVYKNDKEVESVALQREQIFSTINFLSLCIPTIIIITTILTATICIAFSVLTVLFSSSVVDFRQLFCNIVMLTSCGAEQRNLFIPLVVVSGENSMLPKRFFYANYYPLPPPPTTHQSYTYHYQQHHPHSKNFREKREMTTKSKNFFQLVPVWLVLFCCTSWYNAKLPAIRDENVPI